MQKRLSITKAAKELGVHRNTLAKWIKNGTIKQSIQPSKGNSFFTEDDLTKEPTMKELNRKLDSILELLENLSK